MALPVRLAAVVVNVVDHLGPAVLSRDSITVVLHHVRQEVADVAVELNLGRGDDAERIQLVSERSLGDDDLPAVGPAALVARKA